MTHQTPISAAAAHYTGVLDQALAEKLVASLRRTTRAQADANKASVVCSSSDYEIAHHDLRTEQIEFWRIVDQLGIDMKLVRECVG
jgi:putative hemolysin